MPYHYTPEYGREQADGARWQRTTPSERRADLPAPQPGFGPGKPSGGINNGAGSKMKRAMWNSAPWAEAAAATARVSTTDSFNDVVEGLTKAAKDQNSSEERILCATKILETIKQDDRETDQRRDMAYRALESVKAKQRLDAQMSQWVHPSARKATAVAPRNEGVHQVFPAMTQAEARKHLASKRG